MIQYCFKDNVPIQWFELMALGNFQFNKDDLAFSLAYRFQKYKIKSNRKIKINILCMNNFNSVLNKDKFL